MGIDNYNQLWPETHGIQQEGLSLILFMAKL